MSRLVGVVPAAGQATRLQPLPCSKELLRVRDRPVMDYLVERMRTAGADEVVVVTRPEKTDVVEHALILGAHVVQGRPRSVGESLALGAKRADGDDIVLIGFPDTVWEPADGFSRLVAALGEHQAALGLFRTPELSRSDVVLVEDEVVRAVEVKPPSPSSDLIWGCAAVVRTALNALAEYAEPGRLFGELAERGAVKGVYLSDSWIDIGTREALARAGATS
ncbi:MAG TPA: NTP transferase domain-containing protein [Gaiellaceae bacterium]|nr:NTP transferase domain-containing protein [Gaiellaceae bacterium]